MLEPNEDGILMELQADGFRRVFAVGVIYLLGALLVWIAFARPPAPGWAVLLIALGIGALALADMLRRATRLVLQLTLEGLQDSSGRMLARWNEMERIERGAFALKPSNGFSIVLKEKQPRAWAPGLWWRLGRRVGVGGVTPQRAARFMAEQMALRLEEPDPADHSDSK